MAVRPDFRRLPIESTGPIVLFAGARLALVLLSLGLALALMLPFEGELVGMLAGVALPWAVALLVLALRNPDLAQHPLFAAGDFVVLGATQLVVPDIYALYRFAALFLVAVHAHFQGERRGLAIAAGGSGTVIVARAIADEGPFSGDVLVLYEAFFAAVALASAWLVGRLRTSESASRMRARELSRRTLRGESEVRRRVAEAIHDGPVQELIGLDMMLAAAGTAAEQGDTQRSLELIGQAREVAEKNVVSLREEIVDLGPFAFEELSYAQAIENCVPVWKRRYGIEVMLTLERIDLPSEIAGHLFRITQEAVVNACRHARAAQVAVSLRTLDGSLELRVTDDGHGFGDVDPLGPSEPGHLGLAAMRERAELVGGELAINSSERGTRVMLTVPLPPPLQAARR
jgi:two-component system NarL family sensor kinase